jgi:hypothetical protein
MAERFVRPLPEPLQTADHGINPAEFYLAIKSTMDTTMYMDALIQKPPAPQ